MRISHVDWRSRLSLLIPYRRVTLFVPLPLDKVFDVLSEATSPLSLPTQMLPNSAFFVGTVSERSFSISSRPTRRTFEGLILPVIWSGELIVEPEGTKIENVFVIKPLFAIFGAILFLFAVFMSSDLSWFIVVVSAYLVLIVGFNAVIDRGMGLMGRLLAKELNK